MVLYVFSMYCPQRLLKTLRFFFLLDFQWRMGDALRCKSAGKPISVYFQKKSVK